MWKSVLVGLILEDIETLECFQTLKDKKKIQLKISFSL